MGTVGASCLASTLAPPSSSRYEDDERIVGHVFDANSRFDRRDCDTLGLTTNFLLNLFSSKTVGGQEWEQPIAPGS
jgi:hypothetical protein